MTTLKICIFLGLSLGRLMQKKKKHIKLSVQYKLESRV